MAKSQYSGAYIVQRDWSILLECEHPGFQRARTELSCYAELEKSLAAFHSYRITPLSLWNAAAQGWTAAQIIDSLRLHSRWEIPQAILTEVRQLTERYGKLKLERCEQAPYEGELLLSCCDALFLAEAVVKLGATAENMLPINENMWVITKGQRGVVKQELTRLGYPILDYAGFDDGERLNLAWNSTCVKEGFRLRDYQLAAISSFDDTTGNGGSGVIVLPCGAGKTIVGIAMMEKLQCETLILTSNGSSVKQWTQELLSKTTLTPSEVGEYSGTKREVRPVTVATYHILTHRRQKDEPFQHMKLFDERKWGLIIYDEVHLLPAPIFRATADIQATRRMGLTATLIREDGCEEDVFSLIGPKRYSLPWKELEQQQYIAEVSCTELRVPLPSSVQELYLAARDRDKFRLASENPAKNHLVKALLRRHEGAGVLIMGLYINQLRQLAEELGAPLITGSVTELERSAIYDAFRRKEIHVLVVSKVANFAVNLPDASVAIEISGSYGSRQEEAQRLGRILRPKSGQNRAYFYTLVSRNTREEEFAVRRQLFLVEQGYEYEVRLLNSTGMPQEAYDVT